SFILSIIVIAVMTSVAFFTYNYSQKIMSDQIAEKIDLIRNNQRGKILGEIKDIKEMTQYFSESSDIKGLISMNNYFIKDGKLVELTNVWSSLITKNSDILTQNNGMLAASEFSYITNENGVVVADSRIGNTDNIKEYVGKKLSENEYSKVLNEEVHIYNGKPYVLFNSKINAEGAEEDGPTGYYVMAMSLDIFYSDSLQSLTSISSFKLLNSNGYILSSSDKSLMGNQIDDSWYETQINSSQESAVRDLENRKQYFDQISKKRISELRDKFIKSHHKRFSVFDSQLHKEIVFASHNNYLIDSYLKMINHFTMLFSYLNDQRSESSREEHINLIDSIIEDNKQKAYKILFRHLDRVEIAKDAKIKKRAQKEPF
ncbi:FCD domain-containing protein, partial [Halanaerobium sp.]|uniref:FCD domain-containing protein n=1 Tax=Halanaerobium sp. TaxID=1895664 RepID=UPI000DE79890